MSRKDLYLGTTFSICIKDLVNISTKLKFLMYVDDTTIYFNLEDFTHLNMDNKINDEIE